jgi:sugar lactone lactonase YvrE
VSTITRVGDFTLGWGESVRWDDRRQRLYFVDCAAQTLHWLDGASPALETMQMSSMPAGIALAEDGRLVVALDDGLALVDVDARTEGLLTRYPAALDGRANDMHADGAGNLVTGTLRMGPDPGSYWWYSVEDGWRCLDERVSNANGPVVIDVDGEPTLVFADTPARCLYAYPYDGRAGTVGERRVFGDIAALEGAPDGAAPDEDDGVWSCVLQRGCLARFTSAGLDRVLDTPADFPSDVCFGGPTLDRAYVVSISMSLGEVAPAAAESGWLHEIAGLGVVGRPEPRVRLG